MNQVSLTRKSGISAVIIALSCLSGCVGPEGKTVGQAGAKKGYEAGSSLIDITRISAVSPVYPVVIIGSGPAGLMAGVYAGRGNIKNLILQGNKPGGLLTETSEVENWPGEISMLGKDIIEKMRAQAAKWGSEIWDDAADKIDVSQWPYKITTQDDKVLYAMTIILCTGAGPRFLGIPGEKEYWGKGVTSCAVCDAPFYKDKEVVVVGGGDSAVEEAIQLSQYASKITILVRKDKMRAAASMQARLKGYPQISVLYNVEPKEIKGNDLQVTAISLYNTQTQKTEDFVTSGVFLAVGHIPNTALVKDTIEVDEQGYAVMQGRTYHTSRAGIFAAGDVQDNRYRQAGAAAGQGICAALDALSFLNEIGFTGEMATKFASPKKEGQNAGTIEKVASLTEFNGLLKQSSGLLVACCELGESTQAHEVLSSVLATHEGVTCSLVDIRQAEDVARKYFVHEAPVFLVFNDGQLVGRFAKPMKADELNEVIYNISQS